MKPQNLAEWLVLIVGLLGLVVCLHNHNDFIVLFVLMLLIVLVATARILERDTIMTQKMEHWVSTSEKLPKKDGYYTVIENSGRYGTYVFHKEGNSEEYWKRCTVAWLESEDSRKE